MLLSIIIPVYKTEQYLNACLKSVSLSADFDYEIILVVRYSDCSAFNEIERYEEEFSNVKVINQTGRGLSNARNEGFKASLGEYIVFFDSDDVISTISFQKIFDLLRTEYAFSDLLVSDYSIVRDDSSLVNTVESILGARVNSLIGTEYIFDFLKKRRNYWNVWQYIYKKKFLEDNRITFIENCNGEDIAFSTKALVLAESISFSHEPYYKYRIGRENSLVNSISLKYVEDIVRVLRISIDFVKSSKKKYSQLIIERLVEEYVLIHVLLKDVEVEENKGAKELISSNRIILLESQRWYIRFLYHMNTGLLCDILVLIRFIRRKLLGIH